MLRFDKKLIYFIKLILESDNVSLTFEQSKVLNDEFDDLINLLEEILSNQ